MNTNTTPLLSKAIAALWSGAVADAIGNKLEFITTVTRERFLNETKAAHLFLTDDTQMTMFLWECLLHGADSKTAYTRWYRTQRGEGMRRVGKASLTGLLTFPTLWRTEAPGSTCMSACAALSVGSPVKNDSKGNGTVMRASPFAFYGRLHGLTDVEARELAAYDAELTHKHPNAAQSSAMLVHIIQRMLSGDSLKAAVLGCWGQYGETGKLVHSIMTNDIAWTQIRCRKAGWIAEEALAMAVGAAVRGRSFLGIVELACNGLQCDSDTIASIAGQLAALQGLEAPQELRNKLDSFKAVEFLAHQITERFTVKQEPEAAQCN